MVEEPRTPIPEEIKSGLVKLAEKLKKQPQVLIGELKTIIAEDQNIQAMEHKEFKIRYAWGILLRRYAAGAGTKMVIRPLTRPRPRNTGKGGKEKWVADLACAVKIIEEDAEGNKTIGPLQYGAGTLWDAAAKNSGAINPDKKYITALTTKAVQVDFMETPGLSLGGNEASFVETDEVMPTVEEFYEQYIKPNEASLLCALGDMAGNSAQNPTDIRVFNVTVVNSGTGEGKMGEFANFNATDDSIMPENFTFWLHPEDQLYDGGSTLSVVGAISYDAKSNKVNFSTHIVVPVVAQKKTIEQVAGQPPTESVSVEGLGEETLPDEPQITPEQAAEPVATPPAEPTPTPTPPATPTAPATTPEPAPAEKKKETISDDDFAI